MIADSKDQKPAQRLILVTGATGGVGNPLCLHLASTRQYQG